MSKMSTAWSVKDWTATNYSNQQQDNDRSILSGTAINDSRFPHQNQDRLCWQNFVDHKRCIKMKGEDYEPCNWFKKQYMSVCPQMWLERWENNIENDACAGPM